MAFWVGSEFDKKNGTPYPLKLVDFVSLSHGFVKLSQLSNLLSHEVSQCFSVVAH
jgi:hypothetical protein